MFCRSRAIIPTTIRRVENKISAGQWEKDHEKNKIFRYHDVPFREPKKPWNIERERPRYKIVDDSHKEANWSPHDWAGMVRPYNKKSYVALVPAVDATLADLLSSNFYHNAQNNQFRMAAIKFNMYWSQRRITRVPMSMEEIQKRHNELFIMTDLKNKPRNVAINKKELFTRSIGSEDKHRPGGVFSEGPLDPDDRRKLFKAAQVEFDRVMQTEAEHKAIQYDEVVSKVWNKTGMIKSYAAIYKG